MTVLAPSQPGTAPRQSPLDVEIVVPVYNEAPHLAERITELRRFLDESFPFRALVTVVDNASTDETFALARQLAASTAGCGGAPPAAEGPGSRPAHGLVDQHGSGRGLHGRRPVHVAFAPCCPWWRRSFRGTAMSPSAPAWPGAPTWCAAPSASSSPAPTTSRSSSPCGVGSAMPSAASRPCAARRPLQLLPLVKDDEWFFDTRSPFGNFYRAGHLQTQGVIGRSTTTSPATPRA